MTQRDYPTYGASGRGKLLLAVDGGGTKTEFVLFTESGEVLRRLLKAGSNPNSAGMEAALGELRSGIDELIDEGWDICASFAGIAGCLNEKNRRGVLDFLKSSYPDILFEVQTDLENVIGSAECGEKCIAAICGTGSSVYAKNGSMQRRIGGWGYLFDSGGSGYDLGRDAVAAALAEGDGIGPATAVTPLLEELIGGSMWDKIDYLYSLPPRRIAAFASVVVEAYLKGDGEAAAILERNMARLAFLINSAGELCGDVPVVLSGGLTSRRDIMERFLIPKLRAGLSPVFADMPQIYGACVRCADLFHTRENGFKENFVQSYSKITGGDKNA